LYGSRELLAVYLGSLLMKTIDIDRDNSGTIGLGWLANLRAAFGLTFQRQG